MARTIDAIRAAIESRPARSAWGKGVKVYASGLLDNLAEGIEGGYIDPAELGNAQSLRAAMLNGARDWKQYSWGGCSLCYNGQIAERLCTPSELKRTKGGENPPNKGEEWLDVQARALYQAAALIIEAATE